MAVFNGTTGNDVLSGTSDADTFNPLTGLDTVIGGAGLDRLNLAWGTLAVNGGISTIAADPAGGFSGTLASGIPPGAALPLARVVFSGIETLALTLTAGSDTMIFDAAPLAATGVSASIDGGGGFDTLRADFSAFADTTFTQGTNFLIAANHGSFAGFEQFDLALGTGTNLVTLQGGADTIRSSGGIDRIDGGAGRDLWLVDLSTWASAISFGWDGDRGMAALSNGSTAKGIEGGSILGGTADDAFFLNGRNPFVVDGREGRDLLVWDEQGRLTENYGAIFADGGSGSFSGTVRGSSFSSIEQVNAALSDADNYAFVDTAPLAAGAAMNLDGGLGVDTLEVDFSGFADTTFALDGTGTAYTSHGVYVGFEHFGMALGGGSNAVALGAGDDTIYSLGGVDQIDAGAGFDFWGGDYSEYSGNLAFTWNGSTGAGSLSNGAVLTGMETGYLLTGAGNDSFFLSGLMPFDVLGGAGRDALYRNDSATPGANRNSLLLDGGGEFFGTLANGQFSGIEAVWAVLGDGDDTVFVDAAPLALGATLTLNGGTGNDALQLDLSALADVTFRLAGATITATANSGSAGTYSGFERVSLLLGGGFGDVQLGDGDDVVDAGRTTHSTIATGGGDDLVLGASGAETVRGGPGDDSFRVHGRAADFAVTQDGLGGYLVTDTNPLDGTDGTDSLSEVEWLVFDDATLALPAYGTGRTVVGTAGVDALSGTAFGDVLRGLGGNDTLVGDGGDDTLNGGAGNDTITGGAGIDTLTYEDAAAGVKVNLAVLGKAQATGGSGGDWLVDALENLTGSAFADTLTGNALANLLRGLAGNDRLDGGAGADTLVGGLGNDSYVVDNAGDTLAEAVGEGTDTVLARIDWTLGEQFENLTLQGLLPLAGTGNALANTLIGNAAANRLAGLGGKDRLDGGAGADTLVGGLGNDTYVVDDPGDVTTELAGEGTDLVTAKVSWALGANLENLTLLGTAALDGTGNDLANVINGNAAANRLSGGAGKDTLSGGAGADLLIGGAGADVLTGGTGADTFHFDVRETALNKDTIRDFAHGEDHLQFDRAAFSALAAAPDGVLPAAMLAIGTAAQTTAQHLIYNPATGALFYDPDGVGGAAQVQVALLSTKPAIDAGDIWLV